MSIFSISFVMELYIVIDSKQYFSTNSRGFNLSLNKDQQLTIDLSFNNDITPNFPESFIPVHYSPIQELNMWPQCLPHLSILDSV